MEDDYDKLKVNDIKALLLSKYNHEAPKGTLKSALLVTLRQLDAEHASASQNAASQPETAQSSQTAATRPAQQSSTNGSSSSKHSDSEGSVPHVEEPKASQLASEAASSSNSESFAAGTHVPELSDIVSAERMAARAKRFSVEPKAVEFENTLASRAERFGLEKAYKTQKRPNQLEKRAEEAAKAEEIAKQKKAALERAKKFGLPVKPDPVEEIEKKRKRAERFGNSYPNKKTKSE